MSDDLLEDRLRRALDARAGQITPERLQPAVPPTAAVPVRRWPWRPSWRSLLVAAAVTTAVVLAFGRPLIRTDPAPTLPPAGPVQPSPSPSTSRPASPPPSQTPGGDHPGVVPATPTGSGRPNASPPPAHPRPTVTGSSGTGTPGSGTSRRPGPPTSPAGRPGPPSPVAHPSSSAT